MFKLLKNKRNKKKGFTLIELIIVIAILGILAAILVPSMVNIVNNARDQVALANARSAYSVAQSTYVQQNVLGTAPAEDATVTDGTFYNAVVANLGTGFTASDLTNINVGASGIVSVTYAGQTYPAPTPTAAP